MFWSDNVSYMILYFLTVILFFSIFKSLRTTVIRIEDIRVRRKDHYQRKWNLKNTNGKQKCIENVI